MNPAPPVMTMVDTIKASAEVAEIAEARFLCVLSVLCG
jgi:hypothetical protein